MHLGLGNFHRAHQAVYTAAALAHTDGPWGILGVAGRSAAVADAMRAQDLRYSVVEIAPDRTRVTVPAVHTGVLVADREPHAVPAAIAAPGTAIVTLTVTEHGYTYSPRTHGLDLDAPAVQADLRGDGPPRTTLGRIVRGLQLRLRDHAAPITMLSCDNLLANGEHTERLVREFVAALPAAERDELLPCLDAAVTLPERHGRPHRARHHRRLPRRRRPAPRRHRPDPGARRTVHHVGARGPVRRRPPRRGNTGAPSSPTTSNRTSCSSCACSTAPTR